MNNELNLEVEFRNDEIQYFLDNWRNLVFPKIDKEEKNILINTNNINNVNISDIVKYKLFDPIKMENDNGEEIDLYSTGLRENGTLDLALVYKNEDNKTIFLNNCKPKTLNDFENIDPLHLNFECTYE